MFDRVLILSASAGAGHIRAAQAVEKTFIQLNAARELRNIDVLDYANKLFRNLYSRTYIEMVDKAPAVLGWLYDHLDKPWRFQKRRLALDKLNTGPLPITEMQRARSNKMVQCSSCGRVLFLP